MQEKNKNILQLLKLIALLLFVYAICRLLFYSFNYSYFQELSLWQLIKIMFFSIRFDLSVIILSNFFFILLFLIPFPFRENKWYRIVLKWLFISVNSLAVIANCVDLVYFQFTLKRTTADVFHLFGGKIGNDLGRLLPLFMKEYWYVVFVWIILSIALGYLYNRIIKQIRLKWDAQQYINQSVLFSISIALSVLIYRGGFQLKPISIVTAGEYTNSKYVPLVVSTPFTILKTLDLEPLHSTIYFSNEADLKKIYSPLHAAQPGDFKKLNIFLIALESFSKEFVGALNGKATGYTPFLDSIISESLTFPNGFSNGKKSLEGIPAIVSSIPTWMNEAYITSPYGSNQMNSLSNLLKKQGYYSAFFHGGTNGTMGFDAFASLAGYDDYFGRREYNNEEDFDGHWGIWDEEFLQYSANTMNKQKQPFFATVFTLTSHHPYPVPDKYKDKFRSGAMEIERSIGYTDYSLRKFFETAKKMPWYNNTLFVFCADHTGVSSDPFYTSKVGNYAIPIIYYLPNGQLKGMDSTITQQIDIMPSILDYLNYPQPYFSFGTSVFDTTAEHYALTYNSDLYQLLENNYSLQFDGEKATYLYKYTTDSLLQTNLINTNADIAKKMENKAKAIIQTYQQSLINNKMIIRVGQ